MNALNPVRTIGSQIVEALEIHDTAHGAAARTRTGELLESVGIPAERSERYPHELSGGMRQRTAIAMALACDPKVLIADEPTTALDVMVQAQILELLDGLCRDLGLALILVTHDLPIVAQLCGRGAVMYAGEIVEHGPVDALYHAPRHPYTRLLFAATPDLETGPDEEIVSIPGAPPRLDRAADGLPVRTALRQRVRAVPRIATRAAAARTRPQRRVSSERRRGGPVSMTAPRCSRSTTSSSATRSPAGSSARLCAGRGRRCTPSTASRSRSRPARCSRSSASRGAARRPRRRRCCASSIRSRARSGSTAGTSRTSAPARCGRCGGGSRSSTRIRTSRSTPGCACGRRSRSRC